MSSLQPSSLLETLPNVWRASSLGSCASPGLPSGFEALDAELPGGGWPTRALTEILCAPTARLEWRLLAPALRALFASAETAQAKKSRAAPAAASSQRPLLLINPPLTPHLPGLQAHGLPVQHLVWIAPETPQQQLWATEQAIKSNAAAAILAWLPQAQPEQVRRLQSHALGTDAPVFLFRPQQVQAQSSAAPLRVHVETDGEWGLRVQILKRRGPISEEALGLQAMPGHLSAVLTPRMRVCASSSRPIHLVEEPSDALARPAQPAAAH